jgi:DNA repair protein RadA/Sms
MIVKMKNFQFDSQLFNPMRSGTMLDRLLSSDTGLMPGTITMAVGDPGVGKTTVLLDLLANLHESGKKVLFISGEMNSIDMYGYVKRFPKFNDVPILFIGEHMEEGQQVLEDILKEGWDVVLMDSWAEIIEILRDGHNGYVSAKKLDTYLLNLLEEHTQGSNKESKNTSFLVIQQVTKAGHFAGSNRLKHMTTAMFHIKFDRESGGRYLHYSKNRRGGVADKLYFDLGTWNKVNYLYTSEATEE